MAQGKIKKWLDDRGFGFIKPDAAGGDVFVHIKAFDRAGLDAPSEGDRLSYDVETNAKSGKLEAVNLKALA